MFLFAESGESHIPLIVDFINHYFGQPVLNFELAYTKPIWDTFFARFGTNAEKVFGPYTLENAIPWYTIMFVIACLLTIFVVSLFKGKMSQDDPQSGQLTLEAGYLAVMDMIGNIIGDNGARHFPVVATFAVLILISNLMGQFPLFVSPTASVNVTYALGVSSFVYYNYIGISENGLLGHLKHFAGPRLPFLIGIVITPLIFVIELISNSIRPFTLGVRLFANMFSDEQVFTQITNLAPPYTHFVVPLVLTLLGVFVAFVQTLVFTLLSMIYIGEVTHHTEHEHLGEDHSHAPNTGAEAVVAHA